MRKTIFLIFLFFIGTTGPGVAKQVIPETSTAITLSFAPVVRKTAQAVVNIFSRQRVVDRAGPFNDPFFNQFFGGDGFPGMAREHIANSLGSGVIIDPSGLIVTNNHVVEAGSDIRVVLADRREFSAKLVLSDERSDLAVLKIDAKNEQLPVIPLGDSDALEVGDLVLAIGNPFGVGQTVTSGIVSAMARTREGISDYQFFIQTDAAINPGNSGGALVNMKGELVGINTAIYSRSGGSIGIGFSIPSNMVKTVATSARDGKSLARPWLGAELQDVSADIAEALGLARPEGALISALHPESPLARAGLNRGDILMAFDGRPTETAREFSYRVATAPIGSTAIIEYMRDKKNYEVRVAMVAAPGSTVGQSEQTLGGDGPFIGMSVVDITPALAEEAGLGPTVHGVMVFNVPPTRMRQFFQRGDIILDVNGIAVDKVATLEKINANAQASWAIRIRRAGRIFQIDIAR